jgi:L-asparaginase II
VRARPDLVGAADGADVQLMQHAKSWFAKGGAEGLLCASDGDQGVALKSEDGSSRPVEPALAYFLAPLGLDLADLAVTPVRTSRNEVVGECAVTSA